MIYLKKDLNVRDIIFLALKEDIGAGDITTESLISEDKFVRGIILAKESFIICGLPIVELVFKTKDKRIRFRPLVKEGAWVKKGEKIAWIYGKARSILTAERVALNFLSFLSGIATKTRKFVEEVLPYKTKIMDTRKTIPGLRILEKYAVRVGGGFNHRFRLDEMILVKENHLKILHSGSKTQNFEQIKKQLKKKKEIEIEVKNLKEFKLALRLNPDIIMLDNMSIKDIRKAVEIRNQKPEYRNQKLEVSGGISLKNVKKVARTGVEMISIGDLTNSIDSVDISLEIL